MLLIIIIIIFIQRVKPIFFLESKEPFRDFNDTINILKIQKNNWVKYLNENAVEVDISTFTSKRTKDFDNPFYNFIVTMPYYFIDGFNGMKYETIKEKRKEKRSSGQMHQDDLVYIAKVSNDYKIIYYETLAFVEKVYNEDADSDDDDDYDYDDALFEHMSSIRKKKPKTYLRVKCTQKMSQYDFNVLNNEIKRMKDRHWICIHVMSFGAVKKEYNALISPKPTFLNEILTTGKYDNIKNTMLYRKNDSKALEITRAIAQQHNLNMSQSTILEKVWDQKMSLIHGPPGTGKTTMILALIHRQLQVYKTKGEKTKILICAPSNYACDEIYRRLENGNYLISI